MSSFTNSSYKLTLTYARRLGIGIIVSILHGGISTAALIASDDFEDYTAGVNLNTGAEGSGWSSNWSANLDDTTVQSVSLSNGTVSGGSQAGRFQATENRSDISDALSRDFASQSGDVYMSFLLQSTSGLGGDDFYNFQITNGAVGNTSAALGVGIRNFGGNPFFARVGSSSNATTNASTNATQGTTFFLVAKFSKDGSANYNRTDLYINPGLTEPVTSDATATSNVTGLSSVSLFTVRSFQPELGDTVLFDELRIGTTFADVLPTPAAIPEPSTPLLILLGTSGLALLRRRS
jgi:hypothetical protein